MRGILIPTGGNPREIDIEPDGNGSVLKSLQAAVKGNIDVFDVVFGNGISLYINDDGVSQEPPNRAIYANEHMVQAGYISQLNHSSIVEEDELYAILHGDIVALGFDWRTGEDRDLTDAEAAQVTEYFTYESTPGSGFIEALLMRNGAEQPGAFEIEARDLDGLAFELNIVGDVLEPDNMNKESQADLGEER